MNAGPASGRGESWVRAFAPAKLNPWLEVLGRRPDGYHELETVMVALDLGDRLAARRTATGTVELHLGGPAAGPDVPRDGRNLAVQGARVALDLARAEGLATQADGLELRLEKHVPSQAGLGGASSDAAAALLAGAAALGLELGPELGPELGARERPAGDPFASGRAARRALAELGSDCAFFLEARGGAALCTGRGERVSPLLAPSPPWHVALLVPSVLAPTAAVYGALELGILERRPLPSFPGGILPPAARLAASAPFNRLEEAALRAVPALRPWRELLEGLAPGRFHLSGSGSSFFAALDERGPASRLLEEALASAAARGLEIRGAWALRTRPGVAALEPRAAAEGS